MEQQVEGLQEGNNTGLEIIEEKTVGTKQNIANRLDRQRKTNRDYTKEIVEMTQGGLIDILNPPVTNRRERIYMKEYKRNLMKRDKKNECITKKIISQNTFKVSVPRKKMHPKRKGNYKEQMDQIIEKYAQAIREIRKERNQASNDEGPRIAQVNHVLAEASQEPNNENNIEDEFRYAERIWPEHVVRW